MPGPMSAPAGFGKNGVANTYSQRDPKKRIYTGKTDMKRGRITETTLDRKAKQLTRKMRESFNQDDE